MSSATSDNSPIRLETEMDSAVVRIVLNTPKANILDQKMITAISDALDTHIRKTTCLIVFEGEGKHFSFGASVQEHQREQAADMLATFHQLFRKLGELGVPTCAVVRGQCLGGGLELASWCTWIVATPSARLGQPEISLAVFPPMASVLLPWRAGGRAALSLCVGGQSVSAEEALQLGLVNAVTEAPEQWWQDLVNNVLSKTSAAALRCAERAARTSLLRAMQTDLPRLEELYLNELMRTKDANEGIKAFLEGRKPSYQHC